MGQKPANTNTPRPIRQRRPGIPTIGTVNVARGTALFFGLYSLLSLVALARGNYNANIWWIDTRLLPEQLSLLLQVLVTVFLLAISFRLPSRTIWRKSAALLFALFALIAAANTVNIYLSVAKGLIGTGFPLPFSLFVAAAFLLLTRVADKGYRTRLVETAHRASEVETAHRAREVDNSPTASSAENNLPGAPSTDIPPASTTEAPAARPVSRLSTCVNMAVTVVVAGIVFVFGQEFCFGTTEQYRHVDAVVVFGAQSLANGQLSPALAGRVDKAIELYRRGDTDVLIMSGGMGNGGIYEADAMCRYAVARGVPAEAIIVDRLGDNTQASVSNSLDLAQQHGFQSLGAVSTFYHMPRIKMFYLSSGSDAVMMPTTHGQYGLSLLRSILREVPAWWVYWLRLVFA